MLVKAPSPLASALTCVSSLDLGCWSGSGWLCGRSRAGAGMLPRSTLTPQRRRGSLYKPPQDASGAYLTQFILAEGQESENGWRECLVGGEWGYERVIEGKGHV